MRPSTTMKKGSIKKQKQKKSDLLIKHIEEEIIIEENTISERDSTYYDTLIKHVVANKID